MNCEIKMTKTHLFGIFNIVFMILGSITLGVGIFFRLKVGNSAAAVLGSVATWANIVIAIGSIIFILFLFGCWSISRSKPYTRIIAYAGLLLVMMIAQIAFGVVLLVQSKDDGPVHSSLETQYLMIFTQYWTNAESGKTIDSIQTNFICCGIEGAEDFLAIGTSIPGSCCGKYALDTCKDYSVYSRGCFRDLKALVVSSGSVIAGIVIAFAIFDLVGIVIALVLAKAMKSAQQASTYK